MNEEARKDRNEPTTGPSPNVVDRPGWFPAEGEAGMLEVERAFVLGDEPPGSLAGLALSGGGIRSAAFGLGVIQAFVAGDFFSRFHYLSTVSGGGYTGTSLTWWLHRGLPGTESETTTGANLPAGTRAEDFPFGHRQSRTPSERAQNDLLNFIRQHGAYLIPTPRLGIVSLVAVVLRSAFLSLSVYFTILSGVLGSALALGLFAPLPERWLGALAPANRFLSNPLLWVAVLIVLFLAFAAIVYALCTRFFSRSFGYTVRTKIQMGIGGALLTAFALLVVGLLPLVYFWIGLAASWFGTEAGSERFSALVLGAGSTLVGTLVGTTRRNPAPEESPSFLGSARPLLAIACVLFGLLLAALAFSDWLVGYSKWMALALSAVGLLAAHMSNTNYLGAHRMYRDRLMELFLADDRAVRGGRWGLASEADRTGLHDMCGVKSGVVKRPYHLINTNAVLIDSETARFRGRGGDSFVLAPLYSGSSATGWVRTDEFMRRGRGTGMSLPSAMAISGAAANPGTGVSGRGFTRGRLVGILMNLLNLRLGYWAPRPSDPALRENDNARVPTFLVPGLSALFGRGLTETAPLIELTDGGHFENLGLYELVRRGARFVVVVDAGEDHAFEFGELANAVERVRVDFGVKIEFDDERPLSALVPRTEDRDASLNTRLCLGERAFAEGRIRYPGDERGEGSGRIVYLKTTLFPGLPADVLGYKLAHSVFPHESTSDQFFDEVQFEAYRELGYHAGWNYLEDWRAREERASSAMDARAAAATSTVERCAAEKPEDSSQSAACASGPASAG